MFRKIEKENPFEEILDQIIENIKEGTLKKGDALPAERNMAEALGVSRPVVREVLRTLALLGIIKTVWGGASYVSENLENSLIEPLSILLRLNNSSVYHNQQLRSALEVEAARLAARNCTPVDAAELQLILARLDAAGGRKSQRRLRPGFAYQNRKNGAKSHAVFRNERLRPVDGKHHYRNPKLYDAETTFRFTDG